MRKQSSDAPPITLRQAHQRIVRILDKLPDEQARKHVLDATVGVLRLDEDFTPRVES